MQVKQEHKDLGQRSRIQAVKMYYRRRACGLNRMTGESNDNVYGSERLDCKILEVVVI